MLDGWTPLHYAAFYLQPTTIKMLVESKANVNIVDKDNATPLSYACGVLTKYIPDGHFRLYAVVATLLFYGADVNVARLSSRHPSKKKKKDLCLFFFPK